MSTLVNHNLESCVLDNSLFSLTYHDNAKMYPERYQIRRSSTKKRFMKNHVPTFIWEYHIFLWICLGKIDKLSDNGYYQDMGKIHPNDLIALVKSDIVVDEVIVK